MPRGKKAMVHYIFRGYHSASLLVWRSNSGRTAMGCTLLSDCYYFVILWQLRLLFYNAEKKIFE